MDSMGKLKCAGKMASPLIYKLKQLVYPLLRVTQLDWVREQLQQDGQ